MAALTSLCPIVLITAARLPVLLRTPCPVIVPCTIQDEILTEFLLPSCDAELFPQVRPMTTPRTSGRKQPSLRLTCGADPKHSVCPITHRDYSSPVEGLFYC